MTLPERFERLPKVMGADIELGNFLMGLDQNGGTGDMASRLLLRNMPGISGSGYGFSKYNPQDIGRKWLDNGSCCYIDLDHLEICLPEVRSAWDFTAAFHAQLRIVRAAQQRAAATLPADVGLQVLACNSDGSGASWGSHLNFLVTRRCFENLFHRRMHALLWLASFHACSILISGQGKVGAENYAAPVDYQISQRADFIEAIVGLQTTYRRPIVNSRNESLCGVNKGYARLHHITCDVNLCHVANVLKVGVLQILLAMLESEEVWIDPALILQDPVSAFTEFSHAPDIDVQQQMLIGDDLSALDLQRRFFDAACAFVETGMCEGIVVNAAEILTLWGDTLDRLAVRDWEWLSRRLDWVLKRSVLEEVMQDNPALTWQSSDIKRLDLLYGSLDAQEGLYWSLEAAQCVDHLVSEQMIERFMQEPPSDTRAFTRAHLLRTFGQDGIESVDWDRVRVRVHPQHKSYSRPLVIHLDDPAGFTCDETGTLFEPHHKIDNQEILTALDAAPWSDPIVSGKAYSYHDHSQDDTDYAW